MTAPVTLVHHKISCQDVYMHIKWQTCIYKWFLVSIVNLKSSNILYISVIIHKIAFPQLLFSDASVFMGWRCLGLQGQNSPLTIMETFVQSLVSGPPAWLRTTGHVSRWEANLGVLFFLLYSKLLIVFTFHRHTVDGWKPLFVCRGNTKVGLWAPVV